MYHETSHLSLEYTFAYSVKACVYTNEIQGMRYSRVQNLQGVHNQYFKFASSKKLHVQARFNAASVSSKLNRAM